MSVKIRLMRVGKKKQPTYRVVVADERSPRDGRIIETIGHYGPRAEPSVVDIDGDKALEWLRKGAQPSEAVQKLLMSTGVWATFEGEKSKPIVTKLNRRGYVTGKHTEMKTKKRGGGGEAAAPAADGDEAPSDDAPKADDPPKAEDAVDETAAEAPAEESAPEEQADES